MPRSCHGSSGGHVPKKLAELLIRFDSMGSVHFCRPGTRASQNEVGIGSKGDRTEKTKKASKCLWRRRIGRCRKGQHADLRPLDDVDQHLGGREAPQPQRLPVVLGKDKLADGQGQSVFVTRDGRQGTQWRCWAVGNHGPNATQGSHEGFTRDVLFGDLEPGVVSELSTSVRKSFWHAAAASS